MNKKLNLLLFGLIVIFMNCNQREQILNIPVAEIPFDLEKNGHLFIRVSINDHKEKLNFIFDTGATADVLHSITADKLGLVSDYQQDVEGAGATKIYDVVADQKLLFHQKKEISNTHIILSDLSSINEVSEEKIDGIIGYSLLNKYIFKIDYDIGKLIFYDTLSPNDTKGYNAIPFDFENEIPIPQFDISFTLNNGKTFTNSILFDSGAGLSLLVNAQYNKKNHITKEADKSLVSKSVNLNSESTSEEIAIKSLTIGDYKFGDLTSLISHDSVGVSSWDGFMGILGAKIIERFNIILDYKSKMLYIKPNNSFADEFEFPLCGIPLKKVDDKIIIGFLDKTIPAYNLGIREGDQLISIDDKSFTDKREYAKLLKEEGKEVKLRIKNKSGQEQVINLKLEKLL